MTDGINVLMEQLIAAMQKYDPNYKGKVRLVVEAIQRELRKRKQFSVADVNRYLEFDSNRYLRMLCRRGYLAAVRPAAPPRRISGFVKTGTWPPPQELVAGEPIGFVYYLQARFRYYLQAWIEKRRSELESKEGVYSLEGWTECANQIAAGPSGNAVDTVTAAEAFYYLDSGSGDTVDSEMTHKGLDVSQMTMEWVHSSNDTLFGDLSKDEAAAALEWHHAGRQAAAKP